MIEHYEYLRNIRVPNGVFISNKNLCGKPDRPSYASDDSEIYDDPPPTLVYAHHHRHSANFSPMSPLQSATPPYSPAMSASVPRFPLPSINSRDRAQEQRKSMLPSPRGSTQPNGPNAAYAPLSSEDRRALDSFRVVL